MKRPASGEANLERVRAWRAACPELAIRSTFIVGFPGETEREFAELLAFLEDAELDRVGCFAYSPVDGARANALPGQLPHEVKEERRERFMAAQARISARRLEAKVGKRIRVIVDRVEGGKATARSSADAPEIDGVVHVTRAAGLKPGEFVEVKINRSDAHDLWAAPVAN
jgi:ribosomal protein S12 methylthiotransferase